MTALAILLTSLALADLVSGGLAGEPQSWRRLVSGLAIAAIFSVAAVCWLYELSAQGVPALAIALAGTVSWSLFKLIRREDSSWRFPRWALASLAVSMAAVFFLAIPDPFPGRLAAWLSASPFPRVRQLGTGQVSLALGVLLFLTAPANAVVRAVLTIAGTPWRRSEERLRGGRMIGILERWLIFGLAVAGSPTAAALVVSAKSLLRFPELSRLPKESDERPAEGSEGRVGIDAVTEYFLLGSLLSWALALAPVLLF